MKITKIITLIVLGLSLSTPLLAGNALSQALIASAKKETKSISPAALKKMIDNEDDIWMLDVREPYMRIEGSIEGMDNAAVSRGVLEFDLAEKIENKDAFIVVYCRAGKSAVLAAKMMKEDLHYTNVVYLEGGIDSWLEAGYSIYNAFGELKLVK